MTSRLLIIFPICCVWLIGTKSFRITVNMAPFRLTPNLTQPVPYQWPRREDCSSDYDFEQRQEEAVIGEFSERFRRQRLQQLAPAVDALMCVTISFITSPT